jgi:hypothetical protein
MLIRLSSVRLRRLMIVSSMLLPVVLPVRQMSAWAQGESGRAGVTGRVTDATGAVIPKATVTLTDTQTGQSRTVTADGAGLYNFPGLVVSTYMLKASYSGFAETRIDSIPLSVGQTAEINLVLGAASAANTVTVTAETEDLTGRDQVANATLIGNEAVENLPTRGRNFTDFALLTPGISQELDRFGLVVNGQRSGNSNISIDGVDFNDPLQNGQRGGSVAAYFFPQVAVREFQVVRTGLSAEVGRTNAGFVNVVTKSGTNRFHGEALYTNRNPWLTWPDALNDPEATNEQNQFAVGVGGPIIHDKLFFFAGVEKTYFEVPFFVRIGSNCPTGGYYDPNNFPQDSGCAQNQYPTGTPPLPAQYAALETTSYGLNSPLASAARLDWQVSPRNTAMMQYMSTFLNNVAYGVSGVSQAAVSNNTTYAQQSQAVVLGLNTAINSTQTNDLHVQYVYDNRQQRPNTPGAAEIDIGDFLNIGGTAAGTYIYRAIREELIDNYSWLLGKHALHFGVDLNIEPETQQREYYPNGLWTVDTLADYIAALPVAQGGGGQSPAAINKSAASGCGAESSACPFQFEQTLPYSNGALPKYVGTQKEFAGYVEDNFRALSRLTLNMGFRYEAQLEPPAPANPAVPGTGLDPSDLTMFQPRFGMAWDVRGNGSTVVRASTGLFDARTPAYILQHVFTDNGTQVASINSSYDQNILNLIPFAGSFGSFSAVPTADQAFILNDIYAQNPAFKNPRSYQAAAAVEQMLTRGIALVISGTHQETWKLQHRLDTNLFQPTVDAATLYPVFPKYNPITGNLCQYGGVVVPCRPNATIAGFHQNYSTGHSTYNSLIFQLRGRFTKRLTGAFNFTWASTRDDDSNERDADRELALDSLCTACYNRGYSQQDIRAQFNMNLVYHIPWQHLIFSTSFITRTPLPYTAVTSGSKQGDFNNDGNSKNDRPILCSQKPYTTCPVSATQINAYKGGAEVGTVVGRNTFRQKSYEYQGNLPTSATNQIGNATGGLVPVVSGIMGTDYRLNNGFLDTYIGGHRIFNADFLNWGFLNLDMRLIKEFRVKKTQRAQFSAECLNCSRAANLNFTSNATSKFTHAQSTMNALTGFYYSGSSAGLPTAAPDTFRSGGPRQIQLGARYIF